MSGDRIFDARVHLFPDIIARLIRKSFAPHWAVNYELQGSKIIEFLNTKGVQRMTGICYTNTPGLSKFINDFMAGLHRKHPNTLVPFGTVLPSEEGCMKEVTRILDGLQFYGIKLHCHLLMKAPDDAALRPIFEAIAERDKVLNIHCGNFSRNGAGTADIRQICNVDRFRKAMEYTPKLKVIVPHIGFDEVQEYLNLMDEFPNLYFDTAMSIGGHRTIIGETLTDARPLCPVVKPTTRLPGPWKPALEQLVPQLIRHSQRFIYGSDFPHLPYTWDLEINQLKRYLPDDVLEAVLWDNSQRLFGNSSSRCI